MRVRWTWPVAAVRGRAATTATRRGCLKPGQAALAVAPEVVHGRGGGAGAEHDGGADELAPLGVRETDDRHLGDRGVVGEGPLHLGRRDGLAPGPQHVADPADDREVPLVVEHAEVAGVVPAALVERGGRRLGILEVAVHQQLAAQAHLAVVAEPELDAGLGESDAPGLAGKVLAWPSTVPGPASVDP